MWRCVFSWDMVQEDGLEWEGHGKTSCEVESENALRVKYSSEDGDTRESYMMAWASSRTWLLESWVVSWLALGTADGE